MKLAKKLEKKGKLAKDQEGKPVIVNEKGEAFSADDAVIAIWSRCTGEVTSEDLAKDISEKSGQGKEQIQEAVDKIVDELEKVELMGPVK